MEMTIIYIVLIVLLLGILWHIFEHLMIVFHKDTTGLFVKKVLEDPYKYVRTKYLYEFMPIYEYAQAHPYLTKEEVSDND